MTPIPTILDAKTIRAAFSAAGVSKGDTVIVHASLRKLGYVAGGAETFVRALLRVVGPNGTVMAPAQSWLNLDPSREVHGLPQEVWPALRAAQPGFDKLTTPSIGMGAVAEAIRTWPGACRSDHPARSWAAVGRRADEITAIHDLDDVHGDASPLGAAERANAKIVLAGVGFDKCTALHLAETRSDWPGKRFEEDISWVRKGDGRIEVRANSLAFEDRDFTEIGSAFEAAGYTTCVSLGDAEITLFAMRDLLAFSIPWMEQNRAAI